MGNDHTLFLKSEEEEIEYPGETVRTLIISQTQAPKLTGELIAAKDGTEDTFRITGEIPKPPLAKEQELTKDTRETLRIRSRHNEYVLDELIGEGGQGKVWQAIQSGLGRSVALKKAIITKDYDDFIKEAFTSAQLDHPNIVPVYDLGISEEEHDGDVPVLTMKRVQGFPWKNLIERDRKAADFDQDNFLRAHLPIFTQVLNAVSYAHSKKIIHRDLKPSQVMIGDYGEIYLLDWGLAIFLAEPRKRTPPIDDDLIFTLASATNPAGTPAYMAPEQAIFANDNLGVCTDIYLLGAILYELLAGHPPHHCEGQKLRLSHVRNNVFDPLPASAPKTLAKITLRCLETKPEKRPEKVREIRAAVEEYLSGAGRKAESIAITHELARADLAEMGNYESLSQQSRRLAEAMSLWPENPEIEFCRNLLLATYVTVALENDDFLLAQLQAERVQDEDWAGALREQVEAARQEAASRIPEPPLVTWRRVAALAGSYMLIAAAVALILYVSGRTFSEEIHENVKSMASIAAKEISASDLEQMDSDRSAGTDVFQQNLRTLQAFERANSSTKAIYALRPEWNVASDVWRVLIHTQPEDVDWNQNGTLEPGEFGFEPGELYEEGIPEMQIAFKKGVPSSGARQGESGEFISGYAPVYNSESRIIGLLGVDVDTAEIREKLATVYYAGIGGGLLLAALLTAAFFAFFQSRRSLKKVRALEAEIQRQNSMFSGKDLYL